MSATTRTPAGAPVRGRSATTPWIRRAAALLLVTGLQGCATVAVLNKGPGLLRGGGRDPTIRPVAAWRAGDVWFVELHDDLGARRRAWVSASQSDWVDEIPAAASPATAVHASRTLGERLVSVTVREGDREAHLLVDPGTTLERSDAAEVACGCLLPLTVAVDVVTFPLQALAVLAYFAAGGSLLFLG